MTTNVFQFGTSWWIQLIGTAMGTPCACIYATIFFAYFERTRIMQKYQNNLLFYRRQIDDIFGIWIPDKNNPTAWTDFQTDLNEYCKLKWETNPLSHQVDFLDLTIWIDEDTRCLQYTTYQKEMNLFLYIPKHSAHPPGVTKSLVYGLLKTYHRQNKKKCDFKHYVKLLFNQLVQRGHNRETLHPLFLETATAIDERKKKMQTIVNNKIKKKDKDELNNEQLFFHQPFHPRGISRRFIQETYKSTCESNNEDGENFNALTNEETGETMMIRNSPSHILDQKIYATFYHPLNSQSTNTAEFYSFYQIIISHRQGGLSYSLQHPAVI